ncbi:serine/threonine-protein kinase [Sorangium cellulosum]|uniref:serine/threonine-protein kinase n=1 Tax=Sorangium cellulosum TaxID=56 RepID=UPI000CF3883B|nr:serine/threonine-protein kinase [Sorangium cellulosum]
MTNILVQGALVGSRYRVERQLAEGGMGVIWAATHLATGERVALKMIRPGAPEDASTRRRLFREARAAAAVEHPNVPTIRGVVELDNGTPILVMDLLEGESLRDKLLREGRIPLAELSRILLPVVSAVGTAHALGIVHRDLKPDNIFLLAPDAAGPEQREDARVRVLDFGIAKLTAAYGEPGWTSGRTETGELLGTPYYMSPEQILGEHDVDHRTDVWSLGVILYECITSVRPTEAESMGKVLKRILTGSIQPIRELAPALPADVAGMIDHMLSPDRAQRPADLREVGGVLGRYAAAAFRPFGPPAEPRAPESDALDLGARVAEGLAAVAADLDGEAATATLRAGSLLPAPPSSAPSLAPRAGEQLALDAPSGGATGAAPQASAAPQATGAAPHVMGSTRGDAALAAMAAVAPTTSARAVASARAAASALGPRNAGITLVAAGVLVVAGAGLSLLRCSAAAAPDTPDMLLIAPGTRAPGDAVAPPSTGARTPAPNGP